MPEYIELDLAGAALRVRLADVGDAADVGDTAVDTAVVDTASDAECGSGLPGEFGSPEPVSTGGGRRTAALAAGALRATLAPLGPLLDEVHAAVAGAAHPPEEFTVGFGIEVGKDLKLGIVGLKGSATMTVSATWRGDGTGTSTGTGTGTRTSTGTGTGSQRGPQE
ncbi:CU044_2847 family protein [Streptomyces sp. NPDC059009]|uniref:CU044_2847 family protein n=1 Tax=Streptomyces sp. NPDC059009 TaxID=3346694 RepID=UPI0036CA8E4D